MKLITAVIVCAGSAGLVNGTEPSLMLSVTPPAVKVSAVGKHDEGVSRQSSLVCSHPDSSEEKVCVGGRLTWENQSKTICLYH